MKKYLRNITVGTALVLVAGSCTGNFEEYNTNQFQIHEADPSTLMKSMIETIVNIQQNDSQMMDQMVGQLGGYLTCANVWVTIIVTSMQQGCPILLRQRTGQNGLL